MTEKLIINIYYIIQIYHDEHYNMNQGGYIWNP